jgi:hypothetical protein
VAVFVPNSYSETRALSATSTLSVATGSDVQTPPCLTQNEQVQARAAMCGASPSHSSVNAMLPQWQLPRISTAARRGPAGCSHA